jgi:hypothetical protein
MGSVSALDVVRCQEERTITGRIVQDKYVMLIMKCNTKLALCLTRPGQRTCTSKLSNMLGTPRPMDAQTRPQVFGNLAQNARFPQRPAIIRCTQNDNRGPKKTSAPLRHYQLEANTG